MVSSSWGIKGDPVLWSIDFSKLQPGSCIDLVATVISIVDDGISMVVSLFPCGTRARIEGLPSLPSDTDMISIYGAVFCDGNSFPTFRIHEQSIPMWFPKPTYGDLLQIRELCSGMGVATEGLVKSGFCPTVACDLRQPFMDAYKFFHPEVTTITGNISDPETIVKIWEAHPRVASLFAGFACQPFSKGGSQKGANDSRANTLYSVLHAGHMMRAPILLLECVSEAGTNNFVIQQVDEFCRQCHFVRSEIYLSLEHCWPGKRDRWWTVLTTKMLGKVALRSFPQIPSPSKLGQIHPAIVLTDDDISQLELTPEEYHLVHEFVKDPKVMFPLFHGKAPTALHAWGSQLCACRCGCRNSGFAWESLKLRGIYGVFLPVSGVFTGENFEMPRLRHPHPTEVAVWNCMKPPMSWPADLRLSLAGLGQMAAPLQMAWVASQVKQHLDVMHFGTSSLLCEQIFDAIRQEVLSFVQDLKEVASGGSREFVDAVSPVSPVGNATMQPVEHESDEMELDLDIPDESFRQQLLDHFPKWVGTPHLGDNMSFTLVSEEGQGAVIQLKSSSSTVGHVIAAEFGISPTSGYVSLWDCITQAEADHSELVSGRSLCLRVEHFDVEPTWNESFWDGYGAPCIEDAMDDEGISPTIPFKAEEHFLPHDTTPAVGEHVQSVMGLVDPLCELTSQQLVNVLPPMVTSLAVVTSLLVQKLPVKDRLTILDQQGSVMADDEIRFHVHDFIALSRKDQVGFLDPLLLTEMIARPNPGLLQQWWKSYPSEITIIVGIVCVNGHWIPFHCHWKADCMHVVSWDDVANPFPRELRQFIGVLTNFVGIRTHQIRVEHRNFFAPGFCGICALRFIDHLLRGKMLPSCGDDVSKLHDIGRSRFRTALANASVCDRPWMWGAGLDSQSMARLSDLLQQHGVPSQQVDNRIHLIVQMLGVPDVQAALVGTAAWRTLKSLANRHKPALQLVLPDELNAQVQKKAQEGRVGVKRSQKKGKKPSDESQKEVVVSLDPSKLMIPKGAFVRADGQPLQQVSIQSIGPFSEGVVLGTLQDCHAYLQAGTNVNQLSLAFLILNASEKEVQTKLVWEQIRVPLRCALNQEPILVTGFLVHLGAGGVLVAKVEPKIDIDALPASCCKVAVYRDQIEGTWHDFCKGPVKYILGCLQPLEVCSAQPDECSCCKWHRPADCPIQEPLLDVWRRQWLSIQFKPVGMETADVFLVCIRFVASQSLAILQLSGVAGVFIEPRSICGREPDLDHQVIWMPHVTMAEATRLRQTNPGVIGVARMGSKLGLRVKTSDAPTVGASVRPGAIFLASGSRLEFEAGPFAFGLDRVAIGKMCSAWGWQARPIHTLRVIDGSQGAVWLVQSGVEPPSNIMPTKQGNIVISKIDRKPVGVPKTGRETVGSSSTIALCRFPEGDKGATTDPWIVNDPWGSYVNKVVPAAQASIDPTAALKQVEDRIERAVLSKLPDVARHPPGLDQVMNDAADSEARVVALEEQVAKLAHQQGQLDHKLDTASKHQDAQLNQLRLQVTAQLDAQGSQMESLFKQQMSHIEQLLTNRSRSRSRFE